MEAIMKHGLFLLIENWEWGAEFFLVGIARGSTGIRVGNGQR
jgi:hypothetical protein